tara:strand:- start:378 stop:632 length:255 start_codon:yes stop_codon:yes gene_type:complete
MHVIVTIAALGVLSVLALDSFGMWPEEVNEAEPEVVTVESVPVIADAEPEVTDAEAEDEAEAEAEAEEESAMAPVRKRGKSSLS